MDADTAQAIEKSKGQLAWFEKRLADLKIHLAGLPSVGCHRPEFLRTQRVIQFVKKALDEEREQLEWLHVSAKEDEELEKKYGKFELSEEQAKSLLAFTEHYAERQKEQAKRQKERERREVDAEHRRAQFKVIPGGRG